MRRLVGAIVTVGFVFQAMAQSGPNTKLFKSYAFDAPLASFSESSGYYDCSEDLGGVARCVDDVEFLGHTFTAALKFEAASLGPGLYFMILNIDLALLIRFFTSASGKLNDSWVHFVTGNSFSLFSVDS